MRVICFFANRIFLAAVLAFGVSLSASGAGFIKFDGVDGESTSAGHEGESDVLSWSWSVVRQESGTTGSTRQRGAAVVEDLVITKVVDKASVKLLESCLQGKVYPKVTLTLDGDFGGVRATYLVIEVTGVAVSSFSVSGSGDENRPTESVALNFDEVKVTYTAYQSDGSSAGNVETTWNVEEAAP